MLGTVPKSAELESTQLARLPHPDLVSAYLQLQDRNRRLERVADRNDDLMRKNAWQMDIKDRSLREKELLIRKLEQYRGGQDDDGAGHDHEGDAEEGALYPASPGGVAVHCRFSTSGCPYRLPSMEFHEERRCRFRPTRCPSLTCPDKPPYARLMEHIQDQHDGSKNGRDRICRNTTNHLVSSYVNIDKEPVFYKTTRMTWVANELVSEGFHFFLECMRVPPNWHIWVYVVGSEREAEMYQTTITLFREDEYGRVGEAGYSAQRSYTGQVISIHRSKEEIAEYSLGFMVHDKQVRPLCGSITKDEEQLFGYEVSVYRK